MKYIILNLSIKQIKNNKRRTFLTVSVIATAVAMLFSIASFGASGGSTIGQLFANIYNSEATGATNESLINILALFLIVIVSFVSISMIMNVFLASSSERIKEFGLIKSVGATKKQIRRAVFYESIIISLISIPIGFILGFVLQLIFVFIANSLIDVAILGDGLRFSFVFNFNIFLTVLISSAFIIFVSSYLPAVKISKISSIEAIKNAGLQTQKFKNTKNSKKTRNNGGIIKNLARKNVRRNKKYFISTVVSTVFSVILILFAYSLRVHINQSISGRLLQLPPMNTSMTFVRSGFYDGYSLNSYTINLITERLIEDFSYDAEILLLSQNMFSVTTELPLSFSDVIMLIEVDYNTYLRLLEQTSSSYGASLLLNVSLHYENGEFSQSNPYSYTIGDSLYIYEFMPAHGFTGTSKNIYIDGAINYLPEDLFHLIQQFKVIIVSEVSPVVTQWFVYTDDILIFENFAVEVFNNYHTLTYYETLFFLNTEYELLATFAMIDFITTFLMTFAIILSLLGFINMINNVMINIALRSKEFAMLNTIGMEEKSLFLMLITENIFLTLKSLTIAAPLGFLASYFGYLAVNVVFNQFAIYPFIAPFIFMILVFLVLFLVNFIVTGLTILFMEDSIINVKV